LLTIEESLISIDPEIESIPYFDWNIGFTEVFTDKYLGSLVGREQDYAVVDGKFAFWPITQSFSDEHKNLTNAYGYFRSVLSTNKSPYLCRRSGITCGATVEFVNASQCLGVGPNINNWLLCIDDPVHSLPHLYFSGSWRRDGQKYDDPDCLQWLYFDVPDFPPNYIKPKNWTRGSFREPTLLNCFDCKKCLLFQSSEECMCSPKDDLCGPIWSGLPNEDWAKVKLKPASIFQESGDYMTAGGATNDPLFIFHHSNIDRHFETWLELNQKYHKGGYFQFPKYGYAKGSNLDDEILIQRFHELLSLNYGDPPTSNKKYTNKMFMDIIFEGKLPYVYDKKYDEK
jgi:hypothetical protein